MKQKFNVTGMTCSACSTHVEKAVNKLDAVRKAEVSLMTNSMTVDYDESALTPDGIIQAVVHAGYGASLPQKAGDTAQAKTERPEAQMEAELSSMKHRLIWSFVFLIPLFYISMGHMLGAPLPGFLTGLENAVAFGLTQLLLTLPIMYINDKYYRVGFKTLAHLGPNMDSLIAVGSSAAVIYGIFAIYQMGYGLGHRDWALVEQYHMDLYFESAGMILTLITLGKYLETRSKGKTSQAITRLMDLAPKTASVLRDGVEVEIPVEEVRVGDRIVVRPGQSIPVDGVIVEGTSAVDESALTGESLPVDKGPGDKVAAAAINKSGSFTFEALRVGEDTTLAQMIRLVEEASSSKAPIAKLADKVAGVFVPVVMVIAAVTAVAWFFASGYDITKALTTGVAVLVISCPCALGLATPVAIMVGTGKGAENGILIKSAEALETLHTVNTGDPAHGQHRGAGQDGHPHPGQAGGHRHPPRRRYGRGGAAHPGRLSGGPLRAPPGHRHRGGEQEAEPPRHHSWKLYRPPRPGRPGHPGEPHLYGRQPGHDGGGRSGPGELPRKGGGAGRPGQDRPVLRR